jgi:hypothetical protein
LAQSIPCKWNQDKISKPSVEIARLTKDRGWNTSWGRPPILLFEEEIARILSASALVYFYQFLKKTKQAYYQNSNGDILTHRTY